MSGPRDNGRATRIGTLLVCLVVVAVIFATSIALSVFYVAQNQTQPEP